jgi:hypothetical protein
VSGLQALNLGLRFLLELAALAAVAYWALRTQTGAPRVVLAVAAPVALAVVWGLFAAPKAPLKGGLGFQLAVEALVFGAATAALFLAGRPVWGVAYAALVVLNRVLVIAWRQ